MSPQIRHRWWVAVSLVSGAVWLGYGAAVMPDSAADRDTAGLVFPADKSVLTSGTFDVIALAGQGEVRLNGKPISSSEFAPPLKVAHVGLSPGMHRLDVGDRPVRFVVALNEEEHDGPPDWPILRRHPMNADPERCAACHHTEVRDDLRVVGEIRYPTACLECHDRTELEEAHPDPLEPLESCGTCHAVHGSRYPALLKAPLEELAAEPDGS